MKFGHKSEYLNMAVDFYGSPIKIESMVGYAVQMAWVDATPAAVVVASAAIDSGTDTFTSPAHGFTTGIVVQLTTDGTLPAPLLVATNYYVIVLTANSFQLASSQANAVAGTPINLTTVGTGNQTVTPTTPLAGAIQIQASNNALLDNVGMYSAADPNAMWDDVTGAMVSVSGAGHVLINADAQMYLYYRLHYTATSGTGTLHVEHFYKGRI